MNYRPEIDGLRALAVLPVIFFHAGFSIFGGGFVGVDIFFVISGYLITSILINDIENNTLSLIQFYERRARRILPALFFMLLALALFSWFWLLPNQMMEFSWSLLSAIAFLSNVFFWKNSGYFDADADEKPLLHTWSLSVEEQFYLIFPIFLLLTWRFGRDRIFWVIVIISISSLLLSEWGWRNKASANFFLAPTRVWEIFTGTITAFIVRKYGVQKNDFFAAIGISFILISICFFDKTTPFPSVYSLLPVIGTLLLILYCSEGTFLAKILSLKIMVGLGLISYSAYLWHQPILVFARMKFNSPPSDITILLFCCLSLVIGYLSWRYIERPFRDTLKFSRKKVWFLSTTGMFLFFIFGVVGVNSEGFKFRLTAEQNAIYSQLNNQPTPTFLDVLNKNNFINDGRKKILIVGDSFAKDFLEGLQNYLGASFESLDVVLWDIPRRCKNVLADTQNLPSYLFENDTFCLKNIDRLGAPKLDKLVANSDLVVVRSFWDVLPTLRMPNSYDYLNSILENRVVFVGSQVFGEKNQFKNLSNFNKITRNTTSDDFVKVLPYSRLDMGYSSYDLINLAKDIMGDRNYFDVFGYFCSSSVCKITNEQGQPLTNDMFHLTSAGELMMFENLFRDEKFKQIWENTIGLNLVKNDF